MMKVQDASQNALESACGVEVRLIRADGMVKALVLDLSRVDGRLLYIGSGPDEATALEDANDYLDACLMAGSREVWQ